jgi:hypothetical protein
VTSPLDRVRDLIGVDLKDIPGATVAGEIPLPDEVLNRFIEQALARRDAPVTAVRIETGDGDRFLAHVSIRGPRLVPQIKVLAQIDRQPQLPQSAVLWLRWSLPGMGPLAMFATPFLSNLKALPPGIRIDGDRIAVDIAELLRARGLEQLLTLVSRLQLGTRAGQAIVRFELRT